MNVTFRAQIATIRAAAAAAGTALPAAVTGQLDRAERHMAAVGAIDALPEALVGALVEALDAGRDPADDSAVLRILARQQLASADLRDAVSDRLDADIVASLRMNADVVVSEWARACASAVDTLRGASTVLGDVDLTDSAAIVRRGDAAPEAWARAEDATELLATIDAGWIALVSVTGLVDIGRIYGSLRIVDASYSQWITHRLAGAMPDPWRYVREGLSLSLPTADEYRARVDRVRHSEPAAVHPDRAPRAARRPHRDAAPRTLAASASR